MKKLLAFALLTIAALAFAADAPVIETKVTLQRVHTDPNSPNPETATAIAYYETAKVIDGVAYVDKSKGWESVSWRLADTQTVTIDVDGKPLTLPYYVVARLVTAIADQEKARKDNPPPAPEAAPAPQTNP